MRGREHALEALNACGFGVKEKQAYLGLLELGQATAVRLAEFTGINRTTAYDILNGLSRRGIVGSTRKGAVLHFHATPPSALLDVLQKKASAFQKALPFLHKRMNIIGKRPTIEFYEGSEGIKRIYQDILETGKTVYSYGSFEISKKISKYYTQDYRKQRMARRIFTYAVTDSSIRKIPLFKERKYHTLTKIYIDDSLKSWPAWTYAYGNKVAVISRGGEHVFGFVIENASLAKKERFIFERLAKNAKPVRR